MFVVTRDAQGTVTYGPHCDRSATGVTFLPRSRFVLGLGGWFVARGLTVRYGAEKPRAPIFKLLIIHCVYSLRRSRLPAHFVTSHTKTT